MKCPIDFHRDTTVYHLADAGELIVLQYGFGLCCTPTQSTTVYYKVVWMFACYLLWGDDENPSAIGELGQEGGVAI